MGRPRKTTATGEDWAVPFLQRLQHAANVDYAAHTAGVRRQTAYARRKTDPAFAAAWDTALTVAVGRLEDHAFTLADNLDASMIKWLLSHHHPTYATQPGSAEPQPLAVVVVPELLSVEAWNDAASDIETMGTPEVSGCEPWFRLRSAVLVEQGIVSEAVYAAVMRELDAADA